MKVRLFSKKYLLKKIAKEYLPAEVIRHRKQGFASPMASWLRSDLSGGLRELLSETNLRTHGFFNKAFVDRLVTEHLERRESHDKVLFCLYMFQQWHNTYE